MRSDDRHERAEAMQFDGTNAGSIVRWLGAMRAVGAEVGGTPGERLWIVRSATDKPEVRVSEWVIRLENGSLAIAAERSSAR